MSHQVRTTLIGHIAVLELNDPPANYLDRDKLKLLADQAEEVTRGQGVRAIVICSHGKHFSAGANFGGSSAPSDDGATTFYDEAARLFAIEVPVVAAVQGAAVGAGLGLACSADFRVASSATRFQANFTRLGFHPGFGLSHTLPRIVGQQHAIDMLYTGRKVLGDEAFHMRLVDRQAAEGAEREEAIAFAQEIASAAPLAVRSIRRTMRRTFAEEVRVAMAHESAEQRKHFLTDDFAIGIAANLARQSPTFTGR